MLGWGCNLRLAPGPLFHQCQSGKMLVVGYPVPIGRRTIHKKMLVCWAIWNERNARVFRNMASLPAEVVASIKAKARL